MSVLDVRTPDVITVAVSRVDGGLTIMRVITTEYRPTTAEEKEAGLGFRVVDKTYDPTPAHIESLIAQYVRDEAWTGGQLPVSWRVVPNDIVDDTTDRTFRNAWKDDGGSKPGTDMPKARNIHRERLRAMRAPLLEALDIEDMRAVEEGLLSPTPNVNLAKRRDIAARKQALRDVTADPGIEAAQTPEQLKAVIPVALRGT
jgi:hypothetical protein